MPHDSGSEQIDSHTSCHSFLQAASCVSSACASCRRLLCKRVWVTIVLDELLQGVVIDDKVPAVLRDPANVATKFHHEKTDGSPLARALGGARNSELRTFPTWMQNGNSRAVEEEFLDLVVQQVGTLSSSHPSYRCFLSFAAVFPVPARPVLVLALSV